MTTRIEPISFYVERFKQEMIANGRLTDFSDGSMNDIISGAIGIPVNELQEYLVAELKKTYFDSATGADLDALAFDHFGVVRTEGELDEDFRERIVDEIKGFASGTKGALEAAIRTVEGVVFVSLVENIPLVVEWDETTGKPKADAVPFRISAPVVYVAGMDGAVIGDLTAVRAEVENTKACGANVRVQSASTKALSMKVEVTFDGATTAEAQAVVFENIKNSVTDYLNNTLGIGVGYVRNNLRDRIVGIYGSAGTQDIKDTVTIDLANTGAGDHQKIIAGTIEVAERQVQQGG